MDLDSLSPEAGLVIILGLLVGGVTTMAWPFLWPAPRPGMQDTGHTDPDERTQRGTRPTRQRSRPRGPLRFRRAPGHGAPTPGRAARGSGGFSDLAYASRSYRR